jgi:uncharacterized protein YndB with AHSA1/START domain
MPRQKDLKRLVRTRMKKTGESYTTARAQVTSKPRAKKAAPVSARAHTPSVVNAVDYAALAGMSDDKLKEKTGRTWQEWVSVLDGAGMQGETHRAIAELVNGKYKIDGWWAQTVTVGYERIKGLRARGQRRDGTYEASKSRTFNVPVGTLFDAWADAKLRRRWLGREVKVRTATAPKGMRLGWIDGSIVAVGFTAKGKTKSVVAVAHTRLRDPESASRMKQHWSERLDALAELLK